MYCIHLLDTALSIFIHCYIWITLGYSDIELTVGLVGFDTDTVTFTTR